MPLNSCPADKRMPQLSYAAAQVKAESCVAAGQEQRLCTRCNRWRWPDEEALCAIAETISHAEFCQRSLPWLQAQ
jgi:hypothetical protein